MAQTSGSIQTPDISSSNDLISISRAPDSAFTGVCLALFVLFLGHAIDINDGTYNVKAMFWLTAGLVMCVIGVVAPRRTPLEQLCRRWLPVLLAAAVAIEAYFLMRRVRQDHQIGVAFGAIAFLGCIQFFKIGVLRLPFLITILLAAGAAVEAFVFIRAVPADPHYALALAVISFFVCVQLFKSRPLSLSLMIIMLFAFCIAGETAFNVHSKFPGIDVFMFQSDAAWAITHKLNPYSFKYPSVYPPGTPFYGPGVVDARGYLTVGFPYPPLSLLLTLPGYWLGGDVRFSHLLAMALSAGLIAAARPGRLSALAATLLLLTPRVIYILDLSFTEPFLVLMFSLVMYCACRWPKAMPYAFGLYLSSKQYAILAVPLLPLLIQGPHHWRMFTHVLFKALLVAAIINVPFFLWDAPAFFRSIVVFQLLQSFRWDALSYLVLIRKNIANIYIPLWISLAPLVVMIPVSVRRAASSPAGFAAAVALVHMLFFSFNKQAFGNYYYFVIAAACWSIAVAKWPEGGIQVASCELRATS